MEAFFLKLSGKSCKLPFPLKESLREPTAVTVGNFDGIHLGHSYLLNKLKEKAKSLKLKSLVVTFCPHPLKVLAPRLSPCELTSAVEKAELLEKEKIDYLCFIRFDRDFANTSARDFLEKILFERLSCRYLLVGYDWRFGKNREGEVELAKEVGRDLGFEVETARPFTVDGHVVSSTLIRRLLSEGRVKEVKKFLGRNYSIKRKVVRGRGVGSKIGFPTANIKDTHNLCLKRGVYAVLVDDKYIGVANYGSRPTFGGGRNVLEVHLINFRGDLRGREVKVTFLDFIREEKRFPSVEDLKRQISQDVQRVKSLYSSLG